MVSGCELGLGHFRGGEGGLVAFFRESYLTFEYGCICVLLLLPRIVLAHSEAGFALGGAGLTLGMVGRVSEEARLMVEDLGGKRAGSGELGFVDVSMFSYVGLVNLPKEWRLPLLILGRSLFDISLEVFGVAPEEPDSLGSTVKQVLAVADDLRVCACLLAELGGEPGKTEMSQAEVGLCHFAGRLAPSVQVVSEDLRVATRGRIPEGRGRGS